MSIISYPGGKSKAVKCLKQIWEQYFDDATCIISPFFGGGSFELSLLFDDSTAVRKISANDFDARLVTFWKQVKAKDPQFFRAVARLRYVTKNRFLEARQLFQEDEEEMAKTGRKTTALSANEVALNYWIMNRCSFGALGMSGGYAKCNADALDERGSNKLPAIDLSRVTFSVGDWELFLDKALKKRGDSTKQVVFLDPPYFFGDRKVNMYGTYGSLQNEFNHVRLFKYLNAIKGWMLCYNNCREIRALYKGYIQIPCNWTYCMTTLSRERSSNNKKTELVIICPF